MSSKTSRSPSPSKSKEKANSVSMFGYAMDARETKALREYKYQSENRSIICASPIAELWEIIARFLANNVPFVTPNLVTVVGALCSWTAFWCVHIFRDISDKDQWVPLGGDNYIYLGAFLIWSYNTLDNVDGKLARNRKMGSPLGQMMDHGCDALTVTLLATALGYGLGVDFWWGMIVWAAGCIMWLFITWEEHYTHILRMEYVAADEAEYGAIILCSAIGLMGGPTKVGKPGPDGIRLPDFVWELPLWEYLGLEKERDNGFREDGKVIILVLATFMGIFTSLSSIVVVARKLGISDTLKAVAIDFTPFIFFISACTCWGLKQDKDQAYFASSKGDNEGLVRRSLFMMIASTLFARMAVTIIHATLVKTGHIQRLFWEPLVPLAGVAIAYEYITLPSWLPMDMLLAVVCVLSWAAFLQLQAAFTCAYADALGVTVLIHPEHPTLLAPKTTATLLSFYTGSFGAALLVHPQMFYKDGFIPYFNTAPTDAATEFYAHAFGASLLALALATRRYATAPAIFYNNAVLLLLLLPLVAWQILEAGQTDCTNLLCRDMWKLQLVVHGMVTFVGVTTAKFVCSK